MTFASLPPYLSHVTDFLSFAAPYLAALALLIALAALLMQISLRGRLRRMGLSRNGNIEESLAVLSRDFKEMNEFRAELEKYLKLTEARLRRSVQGIGLVRFNPFEGTGQGGNQSFAAAFLDERGNGVVFSSLYARDRVGIYAKPVTGGTSTYELTEEESQALSQAQESLVQKKKRDR